jgi:hypothetical protein
MRLKDRKCSDSLIGLFTVKTRTPASYCGGLRFDYRYIDWILLLSFPCLLLLFVCRAIKEEILHTSESFCHCKVLDRNKQFILRLFYNTNSIVKVTDTTPALNVRMMTHWGKKNWREIWGVIADFTASERKFISIKTATIKIRRIK